MAFVKLVNRLAFQTFAEVQKFDVFSYVASQACHLVPLAVVQFFVYSACQEFAHFCGILCFLDFQYRVYPASLFRYLADNLV